MTGVMAGLGSPQDLLIVLAIALLVFGPKKLPEIGHSIGKALRDFRKASGDFMGAFHGADLDLDTSSAPRDSHRSKLRRVAEIRVPLRGPPVPGNPQITGLSTVDIRKALN